MSSVKNDELELIKTDGLEDYIKKEIIPILLDKKKS